MATTLNSFIGPSCADAQVAGLSKCLFCGSLSRKGKDWVRHFDGIPCVICLIRMVCEIQKSYPEVDIGSYPQYGKDVAYKVRVTFEGPEAADVIHAAQQALHAFGPSFVKEE